MLLRERRDSRAAVFERPAHESEGETACRASSSRCPRARAKRRVADILRQSSARFRRRDRLTKAALEQRRLEDRHERRRAQAVVDGEGTRADG